MGAGAATIGVPYLAVFVIPHHAQILQLIQAADPVAGPLASLGTHMRFYEVFWGLLRHVGPAKLLLVPVSFQIPLILLALITLLVPPSTRALCDGSACRAAAYRHPVVVRLPAADPGGAGVAKTYYTADGSAPSTPSRPP